MIFVTVGTPQQPFDRLVKAADDFAAGSDEKVIIQCGNCTFEPQHAISFRWTTSQAMDQYTCDARVVISQASAGAVILAVKYAKPVILAPRLSKFHEHYNDHQMQLANALKEQGMAIVLEELNPPALQAALERVESLVPVRSTRGLLVEGIKVQLEAWLIDNDTGQPQP